MDFMDTLTLDGLRTTRDGYLVANVKASRTGIQVYAGREVDPDNSHGLRDKASVNVYRDESQVFSKDSLASFAHRPVTIDHPPVTVTADNWADYAVGQTGDQVARDGDFVRIPLVVMDGAAIKAIRAGKNQISQGYSCELDYTPGVTADGLTYDCAQTNIRGNHTAVVGVARGGPELKIGDKAMTDVKLTQIVRDGVPVDVNDAAKILIDGLDAKLARLTVDVAAKDTKIAELTTNGSTKDAEIATLKAQVADAVITPQKLRDAAKAYSITVDAAKKIAPTANVTDSMDEPAIKKAVVSVKLGDAAKGWTDAQIETSFATLAASFVGDGNKTLADGLANSVNVGDALVTDAAKARAERQKRFATGHVQAA